MKKLIFSVLFLTAISLYARNPDKAKLDKLFDLIEENNQGMGRISVFQDGREIYARSYGYSDLANSKRADENTKYRIASITKTFMATIIMKLVEEGKLSLDDKLDKYYPDVPYADKIMVRDLLSHRTGFGRRLDQANQTSNSKEEVLSKLPLYDPAFLGEYGNYEYGNINFVLLTFIAEDVSGKPLSQLLDEIIIKPIGLKNTYLGGEFNPADNEAQTYRWNNEWRLIPHRDNNLPLGAGGLVSTPFDINTFFYALLNGEIISKESLRKMLPKEGWNYGFGLMRMNAGNLQGCGHNGIIGDFRSLERFYPEKQLSIGITSNAMIMTNAAIADNVLNILLETPEYELPDLSAPRPAANNPQRPAGDHPPVRQ